jgi:DNA-binding transcriptional MerR regulator
MAKAKKVGSEGQSKVESLIVLDLRQVRANTYQSTRRGVVPALTAVGFGLFEKLEGHEDKEPLWVMLTRNKPESWALGVALLDTHEPEIKELADSIAGSTQLHNVGIVPVDESDSNKGYDVVYGMMRCLACAYNHCRSGGVLPLTVKAEIAQDITDPNDLLCAPEPNRRHRSESLIDEAKQIQFLKQHGMTIPQIAEKLDTNQQNVRNRLKLLRLMPEEQLRVHIGMLGMVNANKLVDQRDNGTAAEVETVRSIPERHRRMPNFERAKSIYTATEKPKDLTDYEWSLWITSDVRRFIAFYLGVESASFRDMVRTKNQAE